MCLTIPGRIVRIEPGDGGPPRAQVDFGVALRPASLVFTPEARVGDFVIVQAGFATRLLDEQEAREALAHHMALEEMAEEFPREDAARAGGT